jgi:hypothetical protein
MKRAGYVARTVEVRDAYKILIGKPAGKIHIVVFCVIIAV